MKSRFYLPTLLVADLYWGVEKDSESTRRPSKSRDRLVIFVKHRGGKSVAPASMGVCRGPQVPTLMTRPSHPLQTSPKSTGTVCTLCSLHGRFKYRLFINEVFWKKYHMSENLSYLFCTSVIWCKTTSFTGLL